MTEHENDYDDYRQREIKRLLADTIFYLQEASELRIVLPASRPVSAILTA